MTAEEPSTGRRTTCEVTSAGRIVAGTGRSAMTGSRDAMSVAAGVGVASSAA